jgi:hypothetical protein
MQAGRLSASGVALVWFDLALFFGLELALFIFAYVLLLLNLSCCYFFYSLKLS